MKKEEAWKIFNEVVYVPANGVNTENGNTIQINIDAIESFRNIREDKVTIITTKTGQEIVVRSK